MEIVKINKIINNTKTASARRKGSGDFASLVNKQDESTLSNVSNLSNINSLLVVDADEDKEAKQYGNEVLDMLEDLKCAILEGDLTISQLQKIESTINTHYLINNDYKLQSIINEIEIRAAVEIAKLLK